MHHSELRIACAWQRPPSARMPLQTLIACPLPPDARPPTLEGGIGDLDFGSFLRPKFAPPEGGHLGQVLPHVSAGGGKRELRFRDEPPRRRLFLEGLEAAS